jgi:multisubunit Na+/H+ antiporter MnhE subunit
MLRATQNGTLSGEHTMRKLLAGLVVAFALFYLLSQPQGAADAVRGAAAAVGMAFENIIEFISALFR